jgi:aldehyde dehydrogenase (NAD+)
MAGKATDIQGESSLQTAGFVNVTLRQPYGVCAAITPWNAPVTMLTFKMAPALIAGNTLVVKSSEKAPLTSLYIAKLVREAGFPPGVLNILNGFGRPCGEALASHMKVRKISFTGSVGGGKAVQEAAARSNLKKVTLELGGKSPLVIFPDADLDKAAQGAALSILLNSGQACIASSRVYVHEDVAIEFRDRLAKALLKKGANPPGENNPLSPATKRGPQADGQQFARIQQYIQDARNSGTEIVTGGQREGNTGFFIQPTLVWQPPEQSRIMKEEVFGPVQCLTIFSDENDVLARANDSEFGLYASVYTRDLSRALRFATAFESGNVGVNVTSPMMTHDMAFGGLKQSGQGRELGQHGLDEWTELKTVYFAL